MMEAMKLLAHLSLVVPHPSNATTRYVSHACGLVMAMLIVLMVQMSGQATVATRDLMPLLIIAHPLSSIVAVESASIAAGGVMVDLTAWTIQMKLTAVRIVPEFFSASFHLLC